MILMVGAIPTGVVGLFSAIYQGKVSAAGIQLVGRRGDQRRTCADDERHG